MKIGLERRLGRLEESAGIGETPHYVIVTTAELNETVDAAVERYRADHPEVPEYAKFVVYVINGSLAERDPLP